MAAAGKKRPADEPAKDWERTLEPVRKLAAKIKEVHALSAAAWPSNQSLRA
jgi:hypothetical protein